MDGRAQWGGQGEHVEVAGSRRATSAELLALTRVATAARERCDGERLGARDGRCTDPGRQHNGRRWGWDTCYRAGR